MNPANKASGRRHLSPAIEARCHHQIMPDITHYDQESLTTVLEQQWKGQKNTVGDIPQESKEGVVKLITPDDIRYFQKNHLTPNFRRLKDLRTPRKRPSPTSPKGAKRMKL